MISKNNNLIDDGFTFVDNVFTQKDILNSKKAKDFSKIAKDCSCTFECANAISTVYDTKNWPSLV